MYTFPITISSTFVQGTHTNFPYLFKNSGFVPSGFWSNVVDKAHGLDIRFYDTDGITELKREVVYYSSPENIVEAWVSIPTLTSTADKVIYCVYGGALIANHTEVWSNIGAVGIYHMQRNTKDSSGSGNHGVGYNVYETSMITNAYVFNATAYIAAPHSASLNLTTGYTLSCWFYMGSGGMDHMLVTKDSDTAGRSYTLYINNSNEPCFFVNGGGGGNSVLGAGLAAYNWYYIVGVHSGSSMKIYVNGVLSGTLLTPPSTNTSTATLQIGAMEYSSFRGFAYGVIDEARVIGTAVSEDWSMTEYNNQYNPATFSNYGTETETAGSDLRHTGKFQIKISKTYIQGTLINFPYLFTESASGIPSSFWNATVPNTGYSIKFYDSDKTTVLKRDIAFFDPANKKIQAWIQIPTISSNVDKYIWCSYGDVETVSDNTVWTDIDCVVNLHFETDLYNTATAGYPVTSSGVIINPAKLGNGAQLIEKFIPNIDIPWYLYLSTKFIYSFWFKTTTTGAARPHWLVCKANYSGTYQASLLYDTSAYGAYDKIAFLVASDGVGSITSTVNINDGVWHYIVAKRYDNDMYLYVDGILSGAPTTGPTTSGYDTEPFAIGRYPGFTEYSECFVDEFRVYVGNGVANIGDDWVKTEYQTQSGAYVNSLCSPATQSGGKLKSFMIG